jgi:hypothetical protein
MTRGPDIRLPIGAMFMMIGLLLALYGAIYERSVIGMAYFTTHLDLCWGGAMLTFGGLMLVLGLRSRKTSSAEPRN